ncbi:hypothetical protein ACHAWO_007935 [Cyclotella atomus]|uniref:Condensin complex subunit 2 n=1 Tax=Cyclotella atomus TaxID=382360 RepID=A0ABD3PRS5_9STRA
MASIENANPNLEESTPTKPPRKRVSISPKKPIVHSPRNRPASKFTPQNDDEWSLDASSSDEAPTLKKKKDKKQKRRRRSSARFLRLSQGGDDEEEKDEEFASSEHLGEIYRQAIRMNAENKINAGNSWGLKLIENMDKFIEEDGSTPRENKKEERSRVNFTKASCTLDASVKIYSYRVDDVHLSSYRVLANLNRTDKKDMVEEEDINAAAGGVVEENGVKKRKERKGGVETIETNLANINMSKLDSAYDIDPLFHKMSKAFDEGGAKGLLLGNLGVSPKGCHIVFDSKELVGDDAEQKDMVERHVVDEEKAEVEANKDEINLQEIDLSAFSNKLESLLASYSAPSVDSVAFVPQLQSLRDDYATLESEGYGVDEKESAKEGRRRLRLYDAPEEEEKEAEKSIHHIALERSRGSVLGMSFDTNFRLSLGPDEDDEDDGGFMAAEEGLGGDGEFAPVDFGGDDGGFQPDFEFQASEETETFTDRQSYNNTKVLLDALCDGDAFYDDRIGSNSDYTFFDMKKFEKATDGNLWAGSQHWKKAPGMAKSQKSARKVMFLDDGAETEKKTKKSSKKDRVFIDFTTAPDTDSVFEKKSKTKTTRKKSSADPFQMPKTKKDFLLPPDADVSASALTRLFSRPNAVVQKPNGTPSKVVGKSVGFYDMEDNALGFDCENDFGGENDTGGFEIAYGDDDGDVDNDMDYRTDHFDEVRKVQKIDINYATVAKKVDVRRLKRDLWAELEEKTAIVPPEDFSDEAKYQDDIYENPPATRAVSFKETVETMDQAQSQHDVTVSFYFICCLHLANEKGLKLDSTGLEDFMISMNDGSSSFQEMMEDASANM